MGSLTTLRLLVRKLSPEEKKVARNFLTAFTLRGTKAPNQAAKLFDLLCRESKGEPEIDDRQIEILIYNQKSGTAFPRLIFRLREKVLESLLLSVNLERENAYSERGRALHEIRKSLSQAQILQSRGVWAWVISLLNECIEKASKFELYEEWAAALCVRMQMRSIDKGTLTFETENREYDYVLRCLAASKRGIEYYHRLTSEIEFKASPTSLDLLEKQIKTLQMDYEETKSTHVAFYLYYLETHYYQEKKQYKHASSSLRHQLALVKHPALNTPSRLAGVYINLAWNELYTRRFTGALRYTEELVKTLPEKHFNLFQCYETNFYAYFYSGKYEKALEAINILLKQDSGSSSEFRSGKREYQKACTLFMLDKHTQVHKILVDLNPIEDDQEGWNLGLRMLHIINDIELEKTENAFNRIENMRKHISKLKKTDRENPREALKYEILRTLVNTKFDFMETRKRKAMELEKLNSNLPEYAWRILSPELIIFDQWFASKVFKQSLSQKVPAYNEPVFA